MKINDLIHRYPTQIGTRQDGICRVRTFVCSNSKVFSLLTDLGAKNTSSSVTNSIEYIRHSLISRGIVSNECEFIEHYEESGLRGDTYDMVSFNSSGMPNWKSVDRVTIEALLECDSDELTTRTLAHPRLLSEIDRICTEIDPFAHSPWPENPEKTKRRNDIESGMISKKSIAQLVECGAGEQELQRLLKQDLSIFAEVYAQPSEDYICFSEFPIADGAVDFAVFSGTSRMDITLIEVKGAEFNIVNQGHYDKFSSKIEEAMSQIRKRVRVVFDDYKNFRVGVHRIRQRVENGQTEYNSFVGPQGYLEVDPEKDVNIRIVVIGGRTRNDHEESKRRHEIEWGTHPSIKVESWDTWLRKIRRE